MIDGNEKTFIQFEELFWSVTRDMGRIWKEVFVTSFPGSQSQLVFTLARKGPMKMTELAKLLGLTGGAVTAASDKLIDNGYVERQPDAHDRRIIYLVITDKGRKELHRLRKIGRERMAEAFSHLAPEQLPVMLDVFGQAAENLINMKGNES